MNRFATLVTTFLVLIPSAFADPYQDLQTGTNLFEGVLHQESADHVQDQADLKLESTDEFFPEGGSAGSSSSRRGTEFSGNFVVIRINDVPYEMKDVPVAAWFAPYVRDVGEQGIVSGYRDSQGQPLGIFGPERNVSIEELAKMAIEASLISQSGCPDLPKNLAAQKSWSAHYVSCAEHHQFAVFSDETVDIARPATRAEVLMTILQAFGTELRDSPPPGITMNDVSASTLFAPAIYTGLNDGVVSGDTDASGNPTGTFRPESPINRAEVSKILSLAVQVYR